MKLILWNAVKWGIPVGLIILGVNGLIDVRLQNDMTNKAAQLQSQVKSAQTLSAKLPQGLAGLQHLETSSVEMQGKLERIQSATVDMDNGLAQLASTVSAIHLTIQHITRNVSVSKNEVDDVRASATQLLQVLQQLASVSSSMSGHLGQMLKDEAQIRADLQALNQKTALVP